MRRLRFHSFYAKSKETYEKSRSAKIEMRIRRKGVHRFFAYFEKTYELQVGIVVEMNITFWLVFYMVSFRISHPLSDCSKDPFWDPENTFSTFVLYLISSLPCSGANFIEKGGNQLKSMTFVLYRNFVVSLMRWNVIENR